MGEDVQEFREVRWQLQELRGAYNESGDSDERARLVAKYDELVDMMPEEIARYYRGRIGPDVVF